MRHERRGLLGVGGLDAVDRLPEVLRGRRAGPLPRHNVRVRALAGPICGRWLGFGLRLGLGLGLGAGGALEGEPQVAARLLQPPSRRGDVRARRGRQLRNLLLAELLAVANGAEDGLRGGDGLIVHGVAGHNLAELVLVENAVLVAVKLPEQLRGPQRIAIARGQRLLLRRLFLAASRAVQAVALQRGARLRPGLLLLLLGRGPRLWLGRGLHGLHLPGHDGSLLVGG